MLAMPSLPGVRWGRGDCSRRPRTARMAFSSRRSTGHARLGVPETEQVMRFLAPLVAISLVSVGLSGSAIGQRPDSQIDARSMALLGQGQAALKAGNLATADDTLETALAVDPRNRGAYIALGHVALA